MEVEARQGKEAGSCCCERVTEERTMREQAGGGWSSGPLLSCEAQEGCWSRLMGEDSREASWRPKSSIETLESCLLSLFVLWASEWGTPQQKARSKRVPRVPSHLTSPERHFRIHLQC